MAKKKNRNKGGNITASQKQVEANRQNAQFSTGPTSQAGIDRSKMNAATHGGYGKDTVLPWEDPNEFEACKAGWLAYYNPQNQMAFHLVGIVIDMSWRLKRFGPLETRLYERLADDPVALTHQLQTLSKVEGRLSRKLEKAMKELASMRAATPEAPAASAPQTLPAEKPEATDKPAPSAEAMLLEEMQIEAMLREPLPDDGRTMAERLAHINAKRAELGLPPSKDTFIPPNQRNPQSAQ